MPSANIPVFRAALPSAESVLSQPVIHPGYTVIDVLAADQNN